MGDMVTRASEIVENTEFTALYDKGYHTGSELKTAQQLGVKTIVAIPDTASNAPDTKYNIANFIYNKKLDTYTCPQKQILTSNQNWYTKNRGKHRAEIKVKQYKTKACRNCPAKSLCTTNKDGRLLERSEYAEYIEQNRINVENHKELYKQRQAIVEHPYGTIKRQWGFCYIMTKKGIKRASADVGLIFVVYNLRRIMNILGHDVLKKYLKILAFFILRFLDLITSFLSHYLKNKFSAQAKILYFYISHKCFIFD